MSDANKTGKTNWTTNPVLIAWIVGFTGMALVGYGFGWAGFEEAPSWAIVSGFVAALLIMALFSLVGESVIEDGVKVAVIAVLFWVAPESPWFDPIKAGLLVGALSALAGNIHGRWKYRTRAGPASASGPEKPARQKTRAERRREDDEQRQIKNRRDRQKFESGKTQS